MRLKPGPSPKDQAPGSELSLRPWFDPDSTLIIRSQSGMVTRAHVGPSSESEVFTTRSLPVLGIHMGSRS